MRQRCAPAICGSGGAIKIGDAGADCSRRRGVGCTTPTSFRRSSAASAVLSTGTVTTICATPGLTDGRQPARPRWPAPTSDTIGPAPYEIGETETRVSIHLRHPGGDVSTLCPVRPEARKGKMDSATNTQRKPLPSTVGRGSRPSLYILKPTADTWTDGTVTLCLGDSLERYLRMGPPTVIVSDGHMGSWDLRAIPLIIWVCRTGYEKNSSRMEQEGHRRTRRCGSGNSEIGWAAVHPGVGAPRLAIRQRERVEQGKAHIAGNVNTGENPPLPPSSPRCSVQYVFEAHRRTDVAAVVFTGSGSAYSTGLRLRQAKRSLRRERMRPCANILDQGHLWYYPPPETFAKMVSFLPAGTANPEGALLFREDGNALSTWTNGQ